MGDLTLLLAVCSLVALGAVLWPGRAGGPAPRIGLLSTPPATTRPVRRGPRLSGAHARRSTGAIIAAEDRLADLLGLVAATLRSGVPASVSLAAAAPAVEDDAILAPVVEVLAAVAAIGEPLSATWLARAAELDSDALRFVGRAWALSERTGAPLADALRSSEEVLRARARARRRLASAAAGPRASMGVLALLPLSGPVVGLACGIGPLQLYFATPWSTASLVVGLGFAGAGWWWSRSILRRAHG